jgi:lysophospholipase L1-like esterase
VRVLVFGASITQGFWDTEGGWVARLRRHYDELQLEDVLSNDEPTIFNLGISGNKVANILKRFTNETEARAHRDEDFAFIFSIGTNDSSIEDGEPRVELSDYKADLQKLVELAKTCSDKILFVGLFPVEEELTTPVPWRENLSYTNERLSLFNVTMKEVASNNNLSYISAFDAFKQKMDAGEKLFADGLHPNNEGHELIFKMVQPELDRILNL